MMFHTPFFHRRAYFRQRKQPKPLARCFPRYPEPQGRGKYCTRSTYPNPPPVRPRANVIDAGKITPGASFRQIYMLCKAAFFTMGERIFLNYLVLSSRCCAAASKGAHSLVDTLRRPHHRCIGGRKHKRTDQ